MALQVLPGYPRFPAFPRLRVSGFRTLSSGLLKKNSLTSPDRCWGRWPGCGTWLRAQDSTSWRGWWRTGGRRGKSEAVASTWLRRRGPESGTRRPVATKTFIPVGRGGDERRQPIREWGWALGGRRRRGESEGVGRDWQPPGPHLERTGLSPPPRLETWGARRRGRLEDQTYTHSLPGKRKKERKKRRPLLKT